MGDYREETISKLLDDLNECDSRYRDFFDFCLQELQESAYTAIDNQAVRGVADAAGFLGGVIRSIPIIRQGPVDEALDGASKFLKNATKESVEKMLNEFRKNECTDSALFAENTRMIDGYFNKPVALITDGEQIIVENLDDAE